MNAFLVRWPLHDFYSLCRLFHICWVFSSVSACYPYKSNITLKMLFLGTIVLKLVLSPGTLRIHSPYSVIYSLSVNLFSPFGMFIFCFENFLQLFPYSLFPCFPSPQRSFSCVTFFKVILSPKGENIKHIHDIGTLSNTTDLILTFRGSTDCSMLGPWCFQQKIKYESRDLIKWLKMGFSRKCTGPHKVHRATVPYSRWKMNGYKWVPLLSVCSSLLPTHVPPNPAPQGSL